MASTQQRAPATGAEDVIRTPFGNFTVGGKIGRGAFAQVYKAWWSEANFFVAIKAFDTSAMSQETVDSVLTEVSLLGRMKHPHILRVLGYHRADPNLYLMLEYAENGSLLKIIKDHGPLSETDAACFTRQVLEALVYLHDRGVIHRDLKAANILLNRKGDVKLADFGVAAVMGDTDKHFTIVGSPYWMAPEIIQAVGHSTLSDIWSLGCTVIELLTGEPPYFGLNPMTAMFKIVQTAAPIPQDLSATMHDFLSKCFHKDPDTRPPASELLKDPLFKREDVPQSVDIASIMKKNLRSSGSSSSSVEPVVPKKTSQAAPVSTAPVVPEVSGSSAGGRHSPKFARRKLKERRDSRLAIPAYKVELEVVPEQEGSSADGDDDENLSDSESSSTASGSNSRRVSLDEARKASPSPQIAPRTASSSSSQRQARLSRSSTQTNPLSEISITIDKDSVFTGDPKKHRPSLSMRQAGTAGAGASGGPRYATLGNPSHSPSPPLSRERPPRVPITPTAAPVSHGKMPASARFKTLPKDGVEGLSKEEAMELEIESLKMMLMKSQSGSDDSNSGTSEQHDTVLSTRVSMLQELVASDCHLPGQIDGVASLQIINDTLWIGGMTGTVLAYSLPRFQLVVNTKLHKSRINSIIRVGSTRVFCSSEEGDIYTFPPKDPSRVKKHAVHEAMYSAIKTLLFVDGDHPRVWSCASSYSSGQVIIMNKRCEVKYKLKIQSMFCATISPTMETCWLGCSGSSISVCDAIHADFRRGFTLPGSEGEGSKMGVRAMLSVGDLIWCASGQNIFVYDPFNFTVEKTLNVAPASVESLALFESVVIAGTSAGTIECFDSISMARLLTLRVSRPGPVSALAAIPGSLLTGRTGVPALFAIPSSSSLLDIWSTPSSSSR